MDLPSALLSTPSIFLLSTLVAIGVLKCCALLHRQYFYWKRRDVPTVDSLPFLGTAGKVFLRRINFIDYSHHIYNCYPNAKYVGITEFTTPTLLVRDPELIKEIMVKEFETFPDHRNYVDEEIEPIFGKNIFALRGDRWRKMRNTLSPSFTASKMKIMFDLVSKCAHDFVDYLVDHPELCSEIDTKEAFRRYTNDVIATTAFGINVNSMKDRNNEFYTKGIESTKSSGLLTLLKFLLFSFSPRLSKFIGLTLVPSAVSKFFKRIVEETVRFREEHGTVRPDMIHLLMQARNKDGPGIHEMTIDDIVAQAFLFFLAGFETSAMLMCYVVHELAVNRDIQDRLRAEIERHLVEGNGGEISYDSLSKMTYMDMVISEALRKHPPAIFVDRLCVKDYQLPPSEPGRKSLIVESNISVWMPIYSLHHDPRYFPNPSKFDPDRFNDENKDNIAACTYIPFGNGPRKCIGNRFALMETKLLVAQLLLKFVLKPTEKTVEPIVFDKKKFALEPKGGFWIGLEKIKT